MARKKKAKKASGKPKASGTKREAPDDVEPETPKKKVKEDSQVTDTQAPSDDEDSVTVTADKDENTPAYKSSTKASGKKGW